jgi:type IV secretory pathway VirB10-like protein
VWACGFVGFRKGEHARQRASCPCDQISSCQVLRACMSKPPPDSLTARPQLPTPLNHQSYVRVKKPRDQLTDEERDAEDKEDKRDRSRGRKDSRSRSRSRSRRSSRSRSRSPRRSEKKEDDDKKDDDDKKEEEDKKDDAEEGSKVGIVRNDACKHEW